MASDYSGLTRNTWPGTWSPNSTHPIALDTELRGTLQSISGGVGDRLTDISGARLTEGMIVYVKTGYTAGGTTRTGDTYYSYKLAGGQSRDSGGAMPNAESNWTQINLAGQTGSQGPVGYAGSAGPTGAPGPTGAQGPAGYAGSVGDIGATGVTGYTGSAGATGPQGNTGSTGPQGNTGATGLGFRIAKTYTSVALLTADTSPTGILVGEFALINTGNVEDADDSKLYLWSGSAYTYVTDLSGAAGITGPQGASGITGDTGASGPQGATGVVGYTGSLGATGVIGYTGSLGDTGATGPQGDTGATGPQGATGVVGYTGSVGATGPQGDAGATGVIGYTGSVGATGPQGDAGYTGSFGASGATGPVGYTGSTGTFSGITAEQIITSNTTASTSTITGALQVAGGAGIVGDLYVGGNVYSASGSPLRNSQITINDAPPGSAVIGDIWYDSTSGASYQYITDGTSSFWIQFGSSF